MCLFFFLACDKPQLHQITTVTDTEQILLRSDCDECCCAVWLEDGDDEAFLFICGIVDGPDMCSGAPPCEASTFTGLGDEFDLDILFNPRMPFCMDEAGGFWIYNYDPNDVANIIVSCQGELTNPDTVHLHIQPLAKVYYKAGTSCFLGPCNN